MNNEIKPDVEVNKAQQKDSNARALVIVGMFVLFFICLIVYEVSTKK